MRLPLIALSLVALLAAPAWAGPVEDRAAFKTELVAPGIEPEEPLEAPPQGSGVERVQYETNLGKM